MVVWLDCMFGNPVESKHVTRVSILRNAVPGLGSNVWEGFLESSQNQ